MSNTRIPKAKKFLEKYKPNTPKIKSQTILPNGARYTVYEPIVETDPDVNRYHHKKKGRY